jgi:hypothetical protein
MNRSFDRLRLAASRRYPGMRSSRIGENLGASVDPKYLAIRIVDDLGRHVLGTVARSLLASPSPGLEPFPGVPTAGTPDPLEILATSSSARPLLFSIWDFSNPELANHRIN